LSELKFEWDAAKAEKNIRDHRVSFDEAKTVFGDENRLGEADAGHSDEEERTRVIGFSERGRLLLVIVTERYEEDDDQATIRLISDRRAAREEKERYARQIRGEDG